MLRHIDIILQDLHCDQGAIPRHVPMLVDGEAIIEVICAGGVAPGSDQLAAPAVVDLDLDLPGGLVEERCVGRWSGGVGAAGRREGDPLRGALTAPVDVRAFLDEAGGGQG